MSKITGKNLDVEVLVEGTDEFLVAAKIELGNLLPMELTDETIYKAKEIAHKLAVQYITLRVVIKKDGKVL